MRIAVAGKGGAGKTTTAATLARVLARRGYRVSSVPFDANVTEADHQGRALIDYAPTSAAVSAVEALADVVMDRTGAAQLVRA